MLLSSGNPYDAAEKVWEVVHHVTLELAEAVTGSRRPLAGATWREFVKGVLAGAGLSEEEAERGPASTSTLGAGYTETCSAPGGTRRGSTSC
ncbi:MAG: hypothetical protein QXT79_02915 [Thermofilaceae archaeon]